MIGWAEQSSTPVRDATSSAHALSFIAREFHRSVFAVAIESNYAPLLRQTNHLVFKEAF